MREDLDTRLLRYIEGELSPAERQEVELELDRSPAAREVLAELARVYGGASIGGGEAENKEPAAITGSELGIGAEEPGAWPLVGPTVGRYVILSRLGTGGMGVVYAAHDPELDRKVALKIMHPQVHDQRGVMRLLREARALAQVSHPNTIKIYDAGEHEGTVFLAMELVRGVTLERWLRKERHEWREIVETFAAAGRGLAAAHAAGLVHRDFKPANVLVHADGRVLVTDFGLVRDAVDVAEAADIEQVLPPRDDLDAITETGVILGTPAYMSPEQLGAGGVGPASDQFGFCVALYEALYGARPFHGRNLVELAESVKKGVVPPPPRYPPVPRAMWEALARGLRPTPEARWPSMTTLVDELMRLCKRRARRPLVVGVAAVTTIGVVGLGVGLVRVLRPEPCPTETELRAELWDDARVSALQAAFTAADFDRGPIVWSSTRPRLEAALDEWARARATVCHEGATDEAQDPRLRCLQRWAGHAGALLDVLAEGGGELLDHAGPAVSTLSPAQACLDQPLAVDEPWPASEAERTRVEALRQSLRTVAALGVAGRLADASTRAATVLQGALALGYEPVEAEAQQAVGHTLLATGALEDAQKAYEAAYWLAQAHGHDRVMAESATALVGLLAGDPQRIEDAQAWARHAHAVLDRMGPPAADVAVVLADHEGTLALQQDDPAAAIALLEPALARAQAVLGEDSRSTGALQQHLARALVLEGRHQQALDLLLPLLPRRERVLGGNHPEIGELLGTIGGLYYQLHQPEPAILHQRRALAVQEAALGPDHWRVGVIRHELGLALRLAGRLDEAAQEQEAAVASLQRAIGAEQEPSLQPTLLAARAELERLGSARSQH